MHTRFNSSQRSALLAVAHAELRHDDYGWLAESEDEVHLLPDGIVRWLFGEGFLKRETDAGQTGAEHTRYVLTELGRRAANEARREGQMLQADEPVELDALQGPLLLLSPAPHSEELDYLLLVPLAAADVRRHLIRLDQLPELQAADRERFEFAQFRDDVYALPLSQHLARLELLPDDEYRLLRDGLPEGEGLEVRSCPDRGVNYGNGWLQWFGGFDSESPLIVSSRVPTELFRQVLVEAK